MRICSEKVEEEKIEIEGNVIKITNKAKFLGILIDYKIIF